MAAKVFALLALFAIVVNAEKDCPCDSNGDLEDKDLWLFLSKLSVELKDPEDKEMNAVLPGILSPLLECNCLEKNRKKRKTMPEVAAEEVTEKQDEPKARSDVPRAKKSIHYKSRRCPHGYAWIGFRCVPEKYLI